MMTRTLKTLLEKVKEHRSGGPLYLTDEAAHTHRCIVIKLSVAHCVWGTICVKIDLLIMLIIC